MTSKVYSVHAKEALDKRLKEVRQLLSLIETQLQKYESLVRVDYGYVGDLAIVEEWLTDAWEFLAETE